MQISDEDQAHFSIYRTEVGSSAIREASHHSIPPTLGRSTPFRLLLSSHATRHVLSSALATLPWLSAEMFVFGQRKSTLGEWRELRCLGFGRQRGHRREGSQLSNDKAQFPQEHAEGRSTFIATTVSSERRRRRSDRDRSPPS